MRRTRNSALLLGLGAAALMAGCGSGANADKEETTASTPAAASSTAAAATPAASSLADVCPSTVVIQTDWFPESDHSESYAIAAADGKVDKGKKTYTAALMDGDVDTGVKVQIRAGGPSIGFQAVARSRSSTSRSPSTAPYIKSPPRARWMKRSATACRPVSTSLPPGSTPRSPGSR